MYIQDILKEKQNSVLTCIRQIKLTSIEEYGSPESELSLLRYCYYRLIYFVSGNIIERPNYDLHVQVKKLLDTPTGSCVSKDTVLELCNLLMTELRQYCKGTLFAPYWTTADVAGSIHSANGGNKDLLEAAIEDRIKQNNSSADISILKKSPMFNLSLSSKELFHSNLLAWIAEDEDTCDLFIAILQLFGVSDNLAKEYAEGIRNGKYVIKREYNNFDFCICENLDNWKRKIDETEEEKILGQVVLVLENKFKSIPYEHQLIEYQDKVKEINKTGFENKAKLDYLNNNCERVPKSWKKILLNYTNSPLSCHFVLLSLSDIICGLGNLKTEDCIIVKNNKWKVVSYKQYAELITYTVRNQNTYKSSVLADYAQYIEIFCKYLEENLPKDISSEKWVSILSSRQELVNIRMDDIWQKLIVNIIANKFCEVSNRECVFGYDAASFITCPETKEKTLVGAGFSRGTGLFEVKIKIDDECLFGIQIQNGYYKRLLEISNNNPKRVFESKLEKLDGLFNYNQSSWQDPDGLNIFDSENQVYPIRTRKDKILQGFGGYGSTFICQSKKISSDCIVEDVLKAIIVDIETVRKKI